MNRARQIRWLAGIAIFCAVMIALTATVEIAHNDSAGAANCPICQMAQVFTLAVAIFTGAITLGTVSFRPAPQPVLITAERPFDLDIRPPPAR